MVTYINGLRPYQNAIEFINAMKEHGPYYTYINCINKNCFYKIPGDVATEGFFTSDNTLCKYIDLVKSYKWQDETPCGVLQANKEI